MLDLDEAIGVYGHACTRLLGCMLARYSESTGGCYGSVYGSTVSRVSALGQGTGNRAAHGEVDIKC